MIFFTRAFLDDAFTRFIRTFFQTVTSVLGGTALNLWAVDWHGALGIALGAAVVSFGQAVDRAGEFQKLQQFVPAKVESLTK